VLADDHVPRSSVVHFSQICLGTDIFERHHWPLFFSLNHMKTSGYYDGAAEHWVEAWQVIEHQVN
jgi:hypothetical protein